jgi:hypothetical protein
MGRALVAGLIAAVALAAGAAAASPSQRAAKPFSAYPSCGAKGKHADRYCFAGDKPVAVFRAFGRREVDYDLCYRKAGNRQRCRDRTTNNPGQRSRTRFDVDGPGKYKLAWFAGGRAVDRDRLVVRERSVFAIGDSLGEGTRPYLPGALKRWDVDQSVSISRHAPEGVSILRRRGGVPGAVVFALGTNDSPGAVATFRNALSDALRIVGKTRCLVVPNILRPPVGGTSYAGYNRAIADLDRRNRNFREVDWAGLVARNRGWLAGDGVHVNATGYAARARAIAKQVERC